MGSGYDKRDYLFDFMTTRNALEFVDTEPEEVYVDIELEEYKTTLKLQEIFWSMKKYSEECGDNFFGNTSLSEFIEFVNRYT